jgi:O-methyltransferase
MRERLSFQKAWDLVKPSLLGKNKSEILYNEMRLISSIPGDFAEIGVFKGSSSKLMRLVFPDRKLHCYDTFCGIAGADPSVDFHKNGEFSASLEEVKARVGEEGVEFHVGKFPESYLEKPLLAFVHVDLDTYAGTKAALEYVFPSLSIGGTILFDDYHWPHCKGVEKAIKEWLELHKVECTVREYQHQCAITKEDRK